MIADRDKPVQDLLIYMNTEHISLIVEAIKNVVFINCSVCLLDLFKSKLGPLLFCVAGEGKSAADWL